MDAGDMRTGDMRTGLMHLSHQCPGCLDRRGVGSVRGMVRGQHMHAEDSGDDCQNPC
jgi:hypothetical protein